MTRIFSSFARKRTVKEIHASSGPPGSSDYYADPRNIGRWVEKTFKEQNIDMPQTVRERIDSAREGELPKELNL